MYQKRNNELVIVSLYLGDYSKQLYLREISKKAGVPVKTCYSTLLILEKDNILKSAVHGKNKYFKLNLSNIQTKSYLLQAEIYKTTLFLDKYPLFKTFLKDVNTNNTIVVFGSFAKFTQNKDSDLDLLIIKEEDYTLPLHLLPYKIHRIELSKKSFLKSLESQEILIKEIEENHVLLNNHSFYVNAMWIYYGK